MVGGNGDFSGYKEKLAGSSNVGYISRIGRLEW